MRYASSCGSLLRRSQVTRNWRSQNGCICSLPGPTLTASPGLCVLFTCLAFFGVEVTVGVSWAIPLDIAGDRAGSPGEPADHNTDDKNRQPLVADLPLTTLKRLRFDLPLA